MREKLHKMDTFIARNDIDGMSPIARDFHDQLTAISGLNRILRVIQSQDEYIRRFSAMSIAKENRRRVAHEEHYKLIEYVEQHDLENFEKLMRRHIERSKETCLTALEEAHYQQEHE
jgi:DNA-binding GntR family transcriptional regulator